MEKRKGVEGEGKLGGAENVCGTSKELIEGRESEGESQGAEREEKQRICRKGWRGRGGEKREKKGSERKK